MEHRDDKNQSTTQQTDLSKAQNQQQPRGQQQGQSDYGSAGQEARQADSSSEGGASSGQASDIEGSSQFVGSNGASDRSRDLVEDDESSERARDGQGAGE